MLKSVENNVRKFFDFPLVRRGVNVALEIEYGRANVLENNLDPANARLVRARENRLVNELIFGKRGEFIELSPIDVAVEMGACVGTRIAAKALIKTKAVMVRKSEELGQFNLVLTRDGRVVI